MKTNKTLKSISKTKPETASLTTQNLDSLNNPDKATSVALVVGSSRAITKRDFYFKKT